MEMTNSIIILLGIAISSIAFGFHLGYSKGIEHGINISIETAIRETINHLQDEFEKVGMKDQFTKIIEKVFDTKRLKLEMEEKEDAKEL
jgi:hypothetical protein